MVLQRIPFSTDKIVISKVKVSVKRCTQYSIKNEGYEIIHSHITRQHGSIQ